MPTTPPNSLQIEKLINAIISNPSNRDLLQIIKSIRNGIHYGTKIRFAHSLVMSLLYKRNVTLWQRLSGILKITKSHGMVLASFAFFYKSLVLFLEWYWNSILEISTPPPRSNEFVAGCIAGFLIYGKLIFKDYLNSSIIDQITLYCGARVVLAIGKLIAYKMAKSHATAYNLTTDQKKQYRDRIQSYAWATSASVIWGSVIYLHRFYPSFLQHGLESSMAFIYDDVEWWDWRTFLGL